MQKKSQLKHYFLLFLLFISLIFISSSSFIVSQEEQSEPTIISRTAFKDIYDLGNNQREATYYMGAVNILNESGVYIPFEEYLDVTIDNGLKFSRNDNFSVTFRPLFVMQDDTTYNWNDIPSNIEKKPWKQTYRGRIKYGFDFNNVSTNIKNNLKYVVLERVDSTGLTWNDIEIEGGSIIVKGKVKFSHNDILKSYTIPLINKTHIVIGNLTSNFVDNLDGTWNISFDPVAEYNFTEQTNIWAVTDVDVNDNPPPANTNPPTSGGNIVYETANAALDADDGSYINVDLRVVNEEGWHLFNVSIQETGITQIDWSWNGKVERDVVTAYFYMWDYTNSEWDSCAPTTTSTSDVDRTCKNSSSAKTYYDATSKVNTFLVFAENKGALRRMLYTDFVKLKVTYSLEAPHWTNYSINATTVYQNDYVKFNATWLDDYGLNYSVFSTNLSGSWLNATPKILSTTNLSENISQITASAGSSIGWMFYANDTDSYWNNTGIQTFTVSEVIVNPCDVPLAYSNWTITTICNKTYINATLDILRFNISGRLNCEDCNISYNQIILNVSSGWDVLNLSWTSSDYYHKLRG